MARACAFGAKPTPGSEDLQVWIDRAQLAAEIIALLTSFAPLAYASLAASLVDINAICAENPEPPAPITIQDILEQTASIPTAGAVGSPALIQKAYQLLRYQQFLAHCECLPPPGPGPGMCPYQGATLVVPQFGVSPAVAYEVDQNVYDMWPVSGTPPNASWGYSRTRSYSEGPVSFDELNMQWSPDQVTWHNFDDLWSGGGALVQCTPSSVLLSPPRITRQGWVRVQNRAPFSNTLTAFNYCFCGQGGTPAPIPPQPPIVDIPAAPAPVCDDFTLCAAINELSHRLTTIATQVSDIQAQLGGTGVLVPIASQTISGEGEVTLVLGTRAVSVELTQLGPEAFTSALGRPRGLMRVGSVRWGDGTGYSARQFIDGDRFDATRPTGALSLSYQLLAGTTGILRQLG